MRPLIPPIGVPPVSLPSSTLPSVAVFPCRLTPGPARVFSVLAARMAEGRGRGGRSHRRALSRKAACALFLAGCAALALSHTARAQGGGSKAPDTSSCAALGEGFVKMPGSDTCVRMRGAVRLDAGTGTGVTRNGGLGNTATDLGTSGPSATPDPWKQAR